MIKDREVLTKNGTYPWSFVTQLFHNGQPSHGGDCKIFEVMTYTSNLTTVVNSVLKFMINGMTSVLKS